MSRLRQLSILAVVAAASVLAAFFGTRAVAALVSAPSERVVDDSVIYPSGRYLVAYVFVSADCGFCKEEGTMAALRKIRASLRRHTREGYAAVSVIGVAIDADLKVGIRYLRELDDATAAFDEISVGSGWLNSYVNEWMWRDRRAKAMTPTGLLVERRVDATKYPKAIAVSRDSLLLVVPGRDSLMSWVNHGTLLTSGLTAAK